MERKINKNAIIVFLILLCITNLGSTIYYFLKYNEVKKFMENPTAYTQNEVKNIKEKVSKLIDLPSDEEPVIVTVTDVEKVRNQPFFAKASNGDKVLIYNNNKKAVLYNPTRNQVLEIGPLQIPSPTVGSATPSANISPSATGAFQPSPTPTKTGPKTIILNGTQTAGLTGKVEKIILEKLPETNIVSLGVASKRDYEKTLIVDLSGNMKNETEEMAKAMGAEISALPEGESKTSKADILVIAGKDLDK